MEIIEVKNYDELSTVTADLIEKQIKMKEDSVLGLATGSSPVGTYKELIKRNLDFSKVRTINLDEYRGLAPDNKQSYIYFMRDNLFNHVNINDENINIPNGLAEEGFEECLRYDKCIEDLGGIDLQLLGLGLNGHIGFNEPNTEFVKGTHVVTLSQSTIDANSRFFESYEEIPKEAITMGIKGIMDAGHIVLIVNGAKKASILKDALCGPITPNVQASILQLHNNVTIVADKEALSELKKTF
jgi:glucosamine-6-phosphate deaminase